MKSSVLVVLALTTVFFAACNYSTFYGKPTTANSDEVFEKALNSDQVPSFDFIKAEILGKSNTCTECHQWANSYEKTKFYIIPGNSAESPLIKKLKNFGGSMPENKPRLSTKAVEILRLWIDMGANQLAEQKPSSTTTTTLPQNPTFADVQKSVLSTNCYSCHNPDSYSNAHHYPFQDYDVLMKLTSDEGDPLVTPGDLSQSAMWDDVSTKDMPPEKAIASGDATALTSAQIDLIKRWIEQGAINTADPSTTTSTTTTTTSSTIPDATTTTTTSTTVTDSTTTTSTTSTTATTSTTLSGPPPAVTFAEISKQIFQINCTACHAAGSPSAKASKIPFTDYSFITNYLGSDAGTNYKLIVPGDLTQSKIWIDVDKADMPPARAIQKGTVPALTQAQKDLLKQWILNGAIEK